MATNLRDVAAHTHSNALLRSVRRHHRQRDDHNDTVWNNPTDYDEDPFTDSSSGGSSGSSGESSDSDGGTTPYWRRRRRLRRRRRKLVERAARHRPARDMRGKWFLDAPIAWTGRQA